ncbi:trypsin-like serine proteases [Pelotomaculum thermopropionicum SI]|uniref:Probable periplasmic serine endoprotease DegP-like n=1 Tax=Pelotomaculum thermopropionicum (strain DSM 13744 / JCM 10971 / SI) TaxID=370438 RepID=A5D565_PELTS|nr:trypsin-like serine proteases [Pelotomaculum thermopropionicum SI]
MNRFLRSPYAKTAGAFLAGVLAVAAVLALAGVLHGVPGLSRSGAAAIADAQAAELPGLGPNTIADIVSRVGPAVVRIDTTVQGERYVDPFFNDPFFRHFFGDQFRIPMQSEERRGLGSGFIVSPDGYILTNEHVIAGADRIEVTVAGRDKPYQARKVGADHDLDLAVLKIDAGNDLPTIPLGNSDSVRVGDWVVAIGNPYGLDHTVTVGVISAKGRPVTVEDRRYKNLLQTDASINPGNSGGPLLNLNGEVVGINTAINAQAQGIGFAIPSSTVKAVFDDLVQKGGVSHPWLGVYLQQVTEELASYFGLQDLSGALVASVVSGGPAEKAGLRRGDIIVRYNGSAVNNPNDLIELVGGTAVGSQVEIEFIRGGERKTVTAVIEAKRP